MVAAACIKRAFETELEDFCQQHPVTSTLVKNIASDVLGD